MGRLKEYLELLKVATRARDMAFAPFSEYPVGAALETADGTIFSGCNIEHDVYNLGLCAERVAVFKAASEGHRSFRRLLVVTDNQQVPCGACLQVIHQFADDLDVIVSDGGDHCAQYKLSSLLTRPFSSNGHRRE